MSSSTAQAFDATDPTPKDVLPPAEDPAIAPDVARSLLAHAVPAKDGGKVFTLGTRQSKLAMVQTELVKRAIEQRWPDVEVRIFGMTTAGDKNLSKPLYMLGGKALWTKELEVALLEGGVDAIVHSLKDVPTELPEGCELGAIIEREDPSDALVVKEGLSYKCLEDMPDGSVIGTSSVRRVAQLRRAFPKLRFADVRGTIQTRLRKLDDPTSPFTAIVIATAGLVRLNLDERITSRITPPNLYHAVGQGAIGVEMRSNDPNALEIIGSLDCWRTSWMTRAERSMLKVLEGGCSVPVGAETAIDELNSVPLPDQALNGHIATNGHAYTNGHVNGSSTTGTNGNHVVHPTERTSHAGLLKLTGTITSLSGARAVLATESRRVSSGQEAEDLGRDVALRLIQQGGREILEELGRHVREVGSNVHVPGDETPPVMEGEDGSISIGMRSINIPPPKKVNGHIPGLPEDHPPVKASLLSRSPGGKTVFGEGEVCQRPAGW